MTSSTVVLDARGDVDFKGYLALPDQPNGGSVIVLQEIFGINANIRAVADTLAAAGYNAIAPDLFWRQQAGVELDPASEQDRERAMTLMHGLDIGLAVQDALAAAEYVRLLDSVNGKIGAVGYCLGGKLAYLLATQAGIDAAVSYYGVAIHGVLDRMGDIQCPLMLHIAEEDHLCPPDAQTSIERAAAAYGDSITVMRHPNVGHAFARRASSAFNADRAEKADRATFNLLSANLIEIA